MLTKSKDWRPSINGLAFDGLGGEDVIRLEELFSIEEVFFALLDLSRDKGLGFVGFSMAF